MNRIIPKQASLALSIFFICLLLIPNSARAFTIERVKSSVGVEAWLVRDHTNPIISMRFAFRGGSALDPKNLGGLANMAASLLDEGAGEIDSKAFQGTLEDLSISLRFSAQRDALRGRLVTLVENSKTAFNFLKLALKSPRFDPEPVERIRSQILSSIRQSSETPGAIASKTLFKKLYPKHPYGKSGSGTETSVLAITKKDLVAFSKDRLAKNNLIIGVVGDISSETLKTTLDDVFGNLPAEAASWKIPEVKPENAGFTLVVEKNIPQSSIVFADIGLQRSHPDFYAAYLMNYILGGGGFTSRLYNTIREKQGLAYSVYSSLHALEKSGLIIGGAGTNNARVIETLKYLRHEWARMADSGVTQKELSDAKTYQTGSYPLRFGSSGSIAAMLVSIQLDNLGINYIKRRNDLIKRVSIKAVNRIAKTLLRPDHLKIVVVGKPKGVKSTP